MSKGKLLAICVVWLAIVACGAIAWRLLVVPAQEQQAEAEHQETIATTSGESRYDHTINFALDGFSGYAILRSNEFRSTLADDRIRIQLNDDRADYAARLSGLQSGNTQMAAFTIDALIKASATLGDMPAVIVAIIDETRGADAMLAGKTVVPNVASLNRLETRFVLTPDSPSETLARVVMSEFALDQLPQDPFIRTNGPAETLAKFRESGSETANVFVLWEPFVSEMLSDKSMHVVVDSSSFRGYIVDVIVANREFLRQKPKTAEKVLAAYFKTAYAYRNKMTDLVLADAKQQKEKLSPERAAKLVGGIRWKNTQENFAHFGIHEGETLQHVEDMITNITNVLLRTKGISADPTGGQPNRLFFGQMLKDLKDSDFHPALSSEAIASEAITLPRLSDDEWTRIREVGELNVQSLAFARGTSSLSGSSHATLDDLVKTLNNWPQYYVKVIGDASRRGNVAANKQLAESRAQVAAEYLVQRGIDTNRVRSEAVDPTGATRVYFVLGEAPY
ncbi:MAG: OmpA family protein [Planctomycetales bacterium]|nr:OmpA family protein [Planctomycetales bacterium]